jgi:hypothetical protein
MVAIFTYFLLVVAIICIGWFIGTIRDIKDKVTNIEAILNNKDEV